MKTTPEERAELREDVNRGLKGGVVEDLLDDIDELIKSNAILSMWTCCAANVCDEAKNHEEARKATETCMRDLDEEIRTLKARAERAEGALARM